MKSKTTPLATVIFLLCLSDIAFCANSFTGKVVGISDGDTIKVLRDGREEKIRLNGIDCPESGQDFGSRAKEFTSSLAFGKTVTVNVKEKDRYGRSVGDVILSDGRVLNQELVREGFAWWYHAYSQDKTLEKLEQDAKASKKGLWAHANPTPPWDFRRGVTPPATAPAVVLPIPSPSVSDARGPPTTEAKPEPKGVTVYGTTTGKKYHADGCRYLNKSKIPLTPEQAVGRGLTPCSVCNPQVAVPASSSALAPIASPQVAPKAAEQTVAVYRTNTGAKYHRAGCRYLSKSMIPTTVTDARASGLSPCSICNPPSTDAGATFGEAPSISNPTSKAAASPSSPSSSLTPSPSRSSTGTTTGDRTATGIPIHTGPRGGRYHYSKSGKKVYERRR